MKDEHLGAWILLRDPFRSRESFFVCLVLITTGIVIKIVTITMDDAYN
jgi:hypothetical protein